MPEDEVNAPAPAPAATPAPAPAPTPATAPAAPAPSPAPAPAAARGPDGKFAAAAPAEAPAPAPAASTFPDNWREEWSGGDPKLLKRLERVESPAAAMKILRDQDLLIRQDKMSKPLPKDATPEQIAEWRAERGIPETPDKYDTKMPDGLVFGEADKPGVEKYLAAMHGTNATPEQVKAGLQAFGEFRQQESIALAELDATERNATEEALRQAWGGNYQQEKARIEAMFANAPTAVKDSVLNARAGKSGLMNKPEVVQWLAGIARELNPTATIVPAGGSKEGAIADEIKSIEATMYNADGSNNKAYWDDAGVRNRYAQLLAAKAKLS
jgi:hypothetical protein